MDRLPSWGTVTTVKAPLAAIARFAAWHLDAGAARVQLFLDDPSGEVAAFFAPHPRVRVVQCDDAWWAAAPRRARQTHQRRQAHNATACHRDTDLDWLAHIDVDEFLISDAPLAERLAAIPEDHAFARIRPAELLAQADPFTGPARFKLTRREAGQDRAALARIYPEFGEFVPEGFLSYTGGKIIARAGLGRDIRFGIHALTRRGARMENGAVLPGVHVGHAHAPSWEVFARHLDFRRRHGSYRRREARGMHVQDVIDTVEEAEGMAGLRRFYDEMCAATPDLLERLAAHGMLLTATLDLDARVARRFGPLPEGAA